MNESVSIAHTFAELTVRLEPYPFVLKQARNGYVLERTSGKFIKALETIDEAAEYVDTICDTAPEHWQDA